MRKLPLVEVGWIDCTSQTSWQFERSIDVDVKMTYIHSVGWRLKSDKEGILLLRQRSDDGYAGDRLRIPRGCIREVRRIE